MSEEYGTIGPNDCFVTGNVLTSARNLVDGFPLSPINFADLCEVIEMAVLHERIIMATPSLQDTPFDVLLREKIVTSTLGKAISNESDKKLLGTILLRCVRTGVKGGIFGLGIAHKPFSHERGLEVAINRIRVGTLMLEVEHGGVTVEPDYMETFNELRETYQVFKDYGDAVFDAAKHFHVHAYAGTSELPYAIDKTRKSVPMALYEELRKLHKDRVDRLLVSSGYKTYNIPPFALIALSRCKSRDDIVPEILRLREEFRKFRETCTTHAERIRDAATRGTHGDIIDLQNDLEKAIEVLTKKVKSSTKDSRFTYQLWNILKDLTPWGITRNVIDRLQAHDIDRQHLRTVNGLMDVWNKLQDAHSYEAILRSDLFKNEFSEEFFSAFSGYLVRVRKYLPVGLSP